MKKKAPIILQRATNDSHNANYITFYSPKHESSSKQDYNTYMKMQKYKKCSEQPQNQLKRQQRSQVKRANFCERSPIIMEQLIKQNGFLIDEIVKYKEQISGYKQTIRKLQRCKSEKCYNFMSSNDTSVTEQPNQNNSNIFESKLVNDSSLKSSKTTQKEATRVKIDQKSKDIFQKSSIYINCSKEALSLEIQKLNEKLCQLIEKAGFERDAEKRKKDRIQISDCVKDLKLLRMHYKQLEG